MARQRALRTPSTGSIHPHDDPRGHELERTRREPQGSTVSTCRRYIIALVPMPRISCMVLMTLASMLYIWFDF
jgi:hypothetical protein